MASQLNEPVVVEDALDELLELVGEPDEAVEGAEDDSDDEGVVVTAELFLVVVGVGEGDGVGVFLEVVGVGDGDGDGSSVVSSPAASARRTVPSLDPSLVVAAGVLVVAVGVDVGALVVTAGVFVVAVGAFVVDDGVGVFAVELPASPVEPASTAAPAVEPVVVVVVPWVESWLPTVTLESLEPSELPSVEPLVVAAAAAALASSSARLLEVGIEYRNTHVTAAPPVVVVAVVEAVLLLPELVVVVSEVAPVAVGAVVVVVVEVLGVSVVGVGVVVVAGLTVVESSETMTTSPADTAALPSLVAADANEAAATTRHRSARVVEKTLMFVYQSPHTGALI